MHSGDAAASRPAATRQPRKYAHAAPPTASVATTATTTTMPITVPSSYRPLDSCAAARVVAAAATSAVNPARTPRAMARRPLTACLVGTAPPCAERDGVLPSTVQLQQHGRHEKCAAAVAGGVVLDTQAGCRRGGTVVLVTRKKLMQGTPHGKETAVSR